MGVYAPASPPWSNWIGDYTSSGLRVSVPSTAEDLVALVDFAVAEGLRIRAVGAGHSTTSIARPDHVLVLPDGLTGALPVDNLAAAWRGERSRLVRLKAGTRVKHANRVLLGDKAVENMGSFDWQTVIGAICTGTHGSSIYTGPMAESVRSIEIVTVKEIDGAPDVRLRRIEPRDGITDPLSFAADASTHHAELIQDDDTFYSAVVSFGCIGVVYSVTIEVVEEYWLEERSEVVGWNDVKRMLRPQPHPRFPYQVPNVLANNRFWEFVVNCAQVQGRKRTGNPACLVIRRNLVDELSKPDDWKKKHHWPPRRIKYSPLRQFGEAHIRPSIHSDSGIVGGIGSFFARGFETIARKAPFEGDLHFSRSYWVLRRERDASKPQEPPDPPPEAISNEIAVPLDRAVDAIEIILNLMADNAYSYAVPFGVRFVAPSRHYLAMQHDRPTCMIEVPLLLPLNTSKRQEQLGDYKRALTAIEDALCYADGHVGGRPHWGQYSYWGHDQAVRRRRLEQLYPQLPEFESTYSRHNAFGTFDNAFTRYIGLRRVETTDEPASEPYPSLIRIAAEHVL